MSILLLVGVLLTTNAPFSTALSPSTVTLADDDSSKTPWESLVPPEDLSGWKILGGTAGYRVEDSVVIGQTTAGSPNTWLITERQFGDFELEYEFLCDTSLNSGVQIRSEAKDGRARGFQVEIDVDEKRKRFWSAGLYEEGDRGWIDDLKDNPEAQAAHKPHDWNHVRVVAMGAKMQTWLNGVPAAEVFDTRRLSGFIGLQVHGVGNRKKPLEIRWRGLRIRDLGSHHWSPVVLPPFVVDEKLGRKGQLELPDGCRTFRVRLWHDEVAGTVEFRWNKTHVKFTDDYVRYSYRGEFKPTGELTGESSIGGGRKNYKGQLQVFSGDETSTTLVLGNGSSRVRWECPGPSRGGQIILSGRGDRIFGIEALVRTEPPKKPQD